MRRHQSHGGDHVDVSLIDHSGGHGRSVVVSKCHHDLAVRLHDVYMRRAVLPRRQIHPYGKPVAAEQRWRHKITQQIGYCNWQVVYRSTSQSEAGRYRIQVNCWGSAIDAQRRYVASTRFAVWRNDEVMLDKSRFVDVITQGCPQAAPKSGTSAHHPSTELIVSFRDEWLRAFFVDDTWSRIIPPDLESRVFRTLQLIDSATTDRDLRSAPSNRFEKLRGHLDGFHAIRVNRRWRLVVQWNGDRGEATSVYLDDHSYR